MLILKYTHTRAQSMMEYLLVMVVVVFIALGALAGTKYAFLSQVHDKSKEYFDTGATAIMGGYYDGSKYIEVNPAPVNGGWCNYTKIVNGVKVRECACPRPAFGGLPCTGAAMM